MCTAATYQTKDFYFGRNLDYEFPYGEEVCIVPRNFPVPLRHLPELTQHHAIIGMAHVEENYPLFYDAVNETGLCIAGLNFVGNAAYAEVQDGKTNVAQFEFILWLLGTCRDLRQAREAIANLNLVGTPFSAKLPSAQLHWMIADKTGCIVLESMADGLHVYENPVGVLTNNPPFPTQLFALNNYVVLIHQSFIFGKLHEIGSLEEFLQFIYHLLVACFAQTFDDFHTGHFHRIESETAHDIFSQRIGKLGVVSLLCFLILNVLLLDDVDLIQRLFMSRNTFYDADMGDDWLIVLQSIAQIKPCATED